MFVDKVFGVMTFRMISQTRGIGLSLEKRMQTMIFRKDNVNVGGNVLRGQTISRKMGN